VYKLKNRTQKINSNFSSRNSQKIFKIDYTSTDFTIILEADGSGINDLYLKDTEKMHRCNTTTITSIEHLKIKLHQICYIANISLIFFILYRLVQQLKVVVGP